MMARISQRRGGDGETSHCETLSRRRLLTAAFAAAVSAAAALATRRAYAQPAGAAGTVVVHKTPTCGCCGLWVEHVAEAGFAVEVHEHEPQALDALKARHGVPRELWSCHTALIDGYVVEGHVPAEDIRRLQSERPDGTGIAVPGMPIGSPGMEIGDRRDPYDVVLFGDAGARSVFASH